MFDKFIICLVDKFRNIFVTVQKRQFVMYFLILFMANRIQYKQCVSFFVETHLRKLGIWALTRTTSTSSPSLQWLGLPGIVHPLQSCARCVWSHDRRICLFLIIESPFWTLITVTTGCFLDVCTGAREIDNNWTNERNQSRRGRNEKEVTRSCDGGQERQQSHSKFTKWKLGVGKPFVGYLEPSLQETKNPYSASLFSVNENPTTVSSASSNEIPTFPTSARQAEPTVSVSVKPTTPIPVLTLLLTQPLVGSMPTVTTSLSWKPQHTSFLLVSGQCTNKTKAVIYQATS